MSSELRWRCRRGMLELDLLLQGFLTRGYERLNGRERAVFQELLAYPDQELLECLLGRAEPADKEVAHVIQCIRNAAHA